jgi:hypothetical protein
MRRKVSMQLSAEDRLELYELSNEYARCFDSNLGQEWAALFAPGGAFIEVGVAEYTTAEAMRDLVSTVAANAPGVHHFITNHIVTPADDKVRGTAYTWVVRVEPGSLRLVNAGIYRDEYVKVDGRWKFLVREFTGWLDPKDVGRPFAFEP